MISRRILLLGFLIQALILINSCDEKSTEPSQPVLSVSHLTVDFGTDQLGLQFYINNGGGSTLEWRIEDTPQNWYRCSPTDGSTVAETDTVEIMVDRVGLTGEFTDTLSISSNGGTAQVEILMEVPTLPTLSVYPANLDFGAVDDSASFRILNSGPGRLEWSISENLDWLELSPDSGSTAGETDTIIVTVQRPNLSNDILNGDIMISSNGGSHTVGVSVHDTVYTAAGIFASLIVERRITRHHMGYSRQDLIAARFDNSHSHCEPVDPLAADSVHCNEYTLIWNDENGDFVYEQTMPRTFLTLGRSYYFSVIENAAVPSFTDSITFPLHAPYLTAPGDSAVISRNSDLGVEWTATGENQITISVILSSDSICTLPYEIDGLYGMSIDTQNDGQHIIVSSQLSDLDPGEYRLVLTNYNAHGISANGYDPDSFIMARSISYVTIYLQ